jgi:hypothetical protein
MSIISSIPAEDKDCPVRNKCIELMKNYTGDELSLRLAQHTADDWLDMYKYVPFVQPVPGIFTRYQAMNEKERKEFDKDNPNWINDNEDMVTYARRRTASKTNMESNKAYLSEAASRLEKDVPRRDKIRAVLATYPSSTVRVEAPSVDWDN